MKMNVYEKKNSKNDTQSFKSLGECERMCWCKVTEMTKVSAIGMKTKTNRIPNYLMVYCLPSVSLNSGVANLNHGSV